MKNTIKIEYYILNDKMSDENFNNAPEQVFEITDDMIIELIKENVSMKKGDYIDSQNLYLKH